MKFQRSLSSITTHNGKLNSQPKMRETKRKACQSKLIFFLLYKHYKKSKAEDPLAFPKS